MILLALLQLDDAGCRAATLRRAEGVEMRGMVGLLAMTSALLAGCAMSTTVLPKPAEGYSALRFKETVRLPGTLWNTWEFPANTVLVADRRRDTDGEVLYCGMMLARELVTVSQPTCVIREGNTLRINAEHLERGFERPIPPGAVEEIRVQ
jgi:hypothetical protein